MTQRYDAALLTKSDEGSLVLYEEHEAALEMQRRTFWNHLLVSEMASHTQVQELLKSITDLTEHYTDLLKNGTDNNTAAYAKFITALDTLLVVNNV